MGFGDVKLSDRELEEYLRQQKLPQELANKYPETSSILGSENYGLDDATKLALLAKKVNPNHYMFPLEAQRASEEAASHAYAKDIANTDNPKDFLEFLKSRDDLNYKIEPKHVPGHTGEYDPNTDTLSYDPSIDPRSLMDTLLHEHQHAIDERENPELNNELHSDEHEGSEDNLRSSQSAFNRQQDLIDQDRLADMTKDISGKHFIRPGSASLNNFLDMTNAIKDDEGVNPDYKTKYKSIKDILSKAGLK